MELITVNISGKVRRERLNGVDYLVAPTTLIVPGVLNGSAGPLLYQLEDIAQNYEAWNGMPLVHGHPESGSARRPKFLEERGLGWVFNTTVQGKLAAEAWFDIDKTNRVDNRIIPAILAGRKVEVSTGLNLDQEMKQGVWNDSTGQAVPYTSIARRYRPDHLAVLSDAKGACATSHGCGVNNEAETEVEEAPGWFKSFITNMFGKDENGEPAYPPKKPKKKKPGEVEEPDPTTNQGEPKMGLTAAERTAIVDSLITNCACGWEEKDRATLTAMDEPTLNQFKVLADKAKVSDDLDAKIKNQEKVLATAKKGFTAGNDTYAMNEQGEFVKQAKEPVMNTESEGKTAIKLEDLPTEVRNAIAYGQASMAKDKAKFIDQLTAHITDATVKNAQRERLAKRDLSELAADAALLPPVKNESTEPNGNPLPVYFGADFGRGNPFVVNKEDVPTPLGLPQWDFSKAANN